jgi:hypothetical protein
MAINKILIDHYPICQTKNDAKKSFKIDVIKWLKFDVKMALKIYCYKWSFFNINFINNFYTQFSFLKYIIW